MLQAPEVLEEDQPTEDQEEMLQLKLKKKKHQLNDNHKNLYIFVIS